MSARIKLIDFTENEINANLSNIAKSLNEIGILRNDKNMIFLQMLILEQELFEMKLTPMQAAENFHRVEK